MTNARAIGLALASMVAGGGIVYLVMRERPAPTPVAPPRDRGVSVPVGARAPGAPPRIAVPPAALRDAGVELAGDALGDERAQPAAAARPMPDVPRAPMTVGTVAPATPLQLATIDAIRAALAPHRAALAGCWEGAPGRVAMRAIVAPDGRVLRLWFNGVPGRPAIRECLDALELGVKIPAPGERVGVHLELELP